MSKKLRNRPPSPEKIARAHEAYKIAKVLVGEEIDVLIRNIIEKHPDTFITAVRQAGIKDVSWQGVMVWIDENRNNIDWRRSPRSLKPGKIQFIKMHRDITGAGLKQAKEEVEAFMAEKGWDSHRWDDIHNDGWEEEPIPF